MLCKQITLPVTSIHRMVANAVSKPVLITGFV